MCRWIAYQGSSIYLENLLFEPEHSLIHQAVHAAESFYEVNGDGFGIGWYEARPKPAIYHSTLPAWNDDNLRHLAGHVKSGLFFAHIRRTTQGAVTQTNCHPFAHDRWMFQHNGNIDQFDRVKQALDAQIEANLYPYRRGETDSETMFFLALSLGLADDPPGAIGRMIALIERHRQWAGIDKPFQMTIAVSDGQTIYASRYSSDRNSPTLYHATDIRAVRNLQGEMVDLGEDAVLILSEPLDEVSGHWQQVPESSFIVAERGEVHREALSGIDG